MIRDNAVLDTNSKVNEKNLQQMLDSAVMTLTGENEPVRAFRRLVTPDDIVGIKSNVWFNLPTPPELERAIERRVLYAGVKKANITIDDGVYSKTLFFKGRPPLLMCARCEPITGRESAAA